MEIPFVYGKIAEKENFTDRQGEQEILFRNFSGLVNTIIISPRRWGKTSLVNQVLQRFKADPTVMVCQIDIFNCRSEEQFYQAFANAVLRAHTSAWESFIANARKYLSKLMPTVTLSDVGQTMELSFGLSFKENQATYDEILELRHTICQATGKKMIVCIDEFQNINEYADSLSLQRKLRAHWQRHTQVCYCLYGSKRHMLMDIFSNYGMPFYKFGSILFLPKIKREEWIRFIAQRFSDSGKNISPELCGQIADLVKDHPYYTQQLSQQTWLRTVEDTTAEIVMQAFEGIIDQLSLLFANLIDSLTARQINFLLAVADGVTNFSAKETLDKYDLGTSANIKNLRKATLEKDLIDLLPSNKVELQDPLFEYWLKNCYQR